MYTYRIMNTHVCVCVQFRDITYKEDALYAIEQTAHKFSFQIYYHSLSLCVWMVGPVSV